MPVLWILWINIFAITLLEANALRLAVATSVLLFGLYRLHCSRKLSGLLIISIALTLHLQVIIFVMPFLFFYFLPWRINRSKLRITFTVAIISVFTILAVQFLSMLPNEKIQTYISKGTSGSAGVSITSVLTIMLFGLSAIALRKGRVFDTDSSFFTNILLACVPSIVLFIFLTNVAVIGDRAWQLALLVFSTFFFSKWGNASLRRIPLFILLVLTLAIQINVLIRYPLSNFFSPPFSQVDYSVRH
jgi:hypothetical protein